MSTHKKNLFEATAKLVDNTAHVRNEDEDSQRTKTAKDHENLSTGVLRNSLWHPAQEQQTHLDTIALHSLATHWDIIAVI